MNKRCPRDPVWSRASPRSSGRPGVRPGPRLCSQVLSDTDAQRSCTHLLLGSDRIPSLWFRVPGEVVERKGVLPPLP